MRRLGFKTIRMECRSERLPAYDSTYARRMICLSTGGGRTQELGATRAACTVLVQRWSLVCRCGLVAVGRSVAPPPSLSPRPAGVLRFWGYAMADLATAALRVAQRRGSTVSIGRADSMAFAALPSPRVHGNGRMSATVIAPRGPVANSGKLIHTARRGDTDPTRPAKDCEAHSDRRNVSIRQNSRDVPARCHRG